MANFYDLYDRANGSNKYNGPIQAGSFRIVSQDNNYVDAKTSIQQQASTLSDSDVALYDAIAKAHPEMKPDAVVAAASAGLQPNSPELNQLNAATAAKGQTKERNPFGWTMDLPFVTIPLGILGGVGSALQTVVGGATGAIDDAVKGVTGWDPGTHQAVRTIFSALSAPGQVATGYLTELAGALSGTNGADLGDNWNWLTDPWQSTDIAAMIHSTMVDGTNGFADAANSSVPGSRGSVFGNDQGSVNNLYQQRIKAEMSGEDQYSVDSATGKKTLIGRQAVSIGDSTAKFLGFTPGSEEYKRLSGITDLITSLATDPTTYISGGATAALKGAKAAEIASTTSKLTSAERLIASQSDLAKATQAAEAAGVDISNASTVEEALGIAKKAAEERLASKASQQKSALEHGEDYFSGFSKSAETARQEYEAAKTAGKKDLTPVHDEANAIVEEARATAGDNLAARKATTTDSLDAKRAGVEYENAQPVIAAAKAKDAATKESILADRARAAVEDAKTATVDINRQRTALQAAAANGEDVAAKLKKLDAQQAAIEDLVHDTVNRKFTDSEFESKLTNLEAKVKTFGARHAKAAKDLPESDIELSPVFSDARKKIGQSHAQAAKAAKAAQAKHAELLQDYATKKAEFDKNAQLLADAHNLHDAVAALRDGDASLLREALAEQFGVNRTGGLDSSKFVAALFGTKKRTGLTGELAPTRSAQAAMSALVKLTDGFTIWERSGRKIDINVANALADATTPAEVVQILAKGVADGSVEQSLNARALAATNRSLTIPAMTSVKAVRTTIASAEGLVAKSKVLQVLAEKPLLRVYDRTQRLVPWAYRFDLGDANVRTPAYVDWLSEAMRIAAPLKPAVDAVKGGAKAAVKGENLAAGAKSRAALRFGDEAFLKEQANAMMRANTPEKAKLVIVNGLKAFTEHVAETRGISRDTHPEWFKHMESALNEPFAGASTGERTYFALAAAEQRAAQKFIINGIDVNNKDIPRAISQMTNEMSLPDVKKVARIVNQGINFMKREGGFLNNVASWLDKNIDQMWRSSVLVFRAAFILRNIAEMQIRMFLKGDLRNPLTMLAMAASGSESKLAHWLNNNFDAYSHDLLGQKFADYNNEAKVGEAMDDLREAMAPGMSALDGGFQRAVQIDGGTIISEPYDVNFTRGWNDMLNIRKADPIQRDVLRTMLGSNGEQVSKYIADWAATKGLSHREAIVDYYYNGPGRKFVDKMIQNRPEHYGEIFKNENGFREWLFSDNRSSIINELHAYTLGFDADIMKALFQKTEKPLVKLLAEKRDAVTRAGNSIDFPVYVRNGLELKGDKSRWTRVVDGFFNFSQRLESVAAYGPETRVAYWREVENLAKYLNDADLAKVQALAEKSLKPIHKIGPDGKTINIGAQSKLFSKIESAAGDKGILTLDDVHQIAGKRAAQETKALFYKAHERKQYWQALRYIFPFGQAWANSMSAWGKLAAQNPVQVYKVERAYDTFSKNGDPGPGLWSQLDPSHRPTFWRNPSTGAMMVDVPIAGETIAAISGAVANAAKAFGVDTSVDPNAIANAVSFTSPLDSYNLLTPGGSAAPGAGVMVSIPFNSLMNIDWFNKSTPEWAKEWINPYPTGASNSVAGTLYDSMVPAWVRRIAAFVDPELGDKEIGAMVPGLTNALLTENPTRYRNEGGNIDNDGMQRLQNDVYATARVLSLGRGIFQSGYPASTIIDWHIKTKDGNHPAQIALSAHFSQMIDENNGDINAATRQFIDLYGADAVVSTVSNYKANVKPSTDGYNFLKDNHADATKFSDVMGMFFGNAQYSAAYDKWLRQSHLRETATFADRVTLINNSLYYMVADRIDQKVANGQLSKSAGADLKSQYADQYGVKYRDIGQSNDWGNQARRVQEAIAQSPAFAETPSGLVAQSFFPVYEEALKRVGTKSLSSKKATEMRAYLRDYVAQLQTQYPGSDAMVTFINKEIGN